MDTFTSTLVILTFLSGLFACSLCVIFYQRSKLKSKSKIIDGIERSYRELLLEKAKLEERCSLNENITEKYNELSQKYCELEKNAVALSTNLEQERKNLQEKVTLLENAEKRLSNTFKSISMDALSKNNENFIDLAKSVFEKFQEKAKSEFSMSAKSVNDMIIPIKGALEGMGNKLSDLEKSRVGAYEALKQQIGDLISTQNSLKAETSNLAAALRNPTIRGRWGEVQLRRVVELAGMVEHCDFEEQVTVSENEKTVRPDMVIYLPENRKVIVDAKAPLSAYLDAMETKDEKIRNDLLNNHAKQIRNHVIALSNKKYWSKLDKSPEFVILFLPGEVFFSVAVEIDPTLIEFAMQERVIISTPTTLLALLNTMALGWKQETLAKDAKYIIKMGQELYKRLSDMTLHMSDLGKNINAAVRSYNSTVASLETRVLVSARKFKELAAPDKNIIELSSVENTARELKDIG